MVGSAKAAGSAAFFLTLPGNGIGRPRINTDEESDLSCPECGAPAIGASSVNSGPGSKGTYRCLVCDHVYTGALVPMPRRRNLN